MNSQELIASLGQKLKVHQEVLKTDGTRTIKCEHCNELIRNHEYTKGLIYAYRDIMGLVVYHDEP